ncbi:MAG: outer membrane protein assembly factor BamB family protein, partial [Planctomycetota bacterium]
MIKLKLATVVLASFSLGFADLAQAQDAKARGWLSWRGPQQNGTSTETDLPEQFDLDGKNGSWSFALSSRGTPVVANGRVYTMGYLGEGSELQEMIVCLDEKTGQVIWEHRWKDFLTDVIYYRFSIASPTIDAETGNVYTLSSAGLFTCFSADGEIIWQHSMMEKYGRLTFPNGRTGSAVIDDDLVIIHVATSSWGPQGPARDRFYAFDKKTGESVWGATPGGPPKDASFSMPVLANLDGRRVLFAGLAGGHLVCINARTGESLWRFQMSIGGMSSSPILYKDSVIAIHGKENLDSSAIGRMIALPIGKGAKPGESVRNLSTEDELWRAPLTAFTSSPVLVGDRVYQTVHTGELVCINAETGEVLWHEKLAPDQIHASPAFGDGKLYVPMNNGSVYIVRGSDGGPEVLDKTQLEGNILAAPAIANGRVFINTTERIYSFAGASTAGTAASFSALPALPVGDATRLQIIPADIVIEQGKSVSFRVRSLDAEGQTVRDGVGNISWSNMPSEGYSMSDSGELGVAPDAPLAAFVMMAEVDGMKGTARVRIVPKLPFIEDFESAVMRPDPKVEGETFAMPGPNWIGAAIKWEVREREGGKVFAKTLANPLFQRSLSFFGYPSMSNYTLAADVLTDGNRRIKSDVGLLNQRYLIRLRGNHQALSVSSNEELFNVKVPFQFKVNTWYRLKTRVDILDDGTGMVRAKAWPRDEDEPAEWTIEV